VDDHPTAAWFDVWHPEHQANPMQRSKLEDSGGWKRNW
jgi:hypothetical protein